MRGRPGAAYLDIPSDVLMSSGAFQEASLSRALQSLPVSPAAADVQAAAKLLASAKRCVPCM